MNLDESFEDWFSWDKTRKAWRIYKFGEDVWSHQQKKIDHLKEENEKLRECVEYISNIENVLKENPPVVWYAEVALLARQCLKDLEHKREENG
jgi:hypothetical protein